MKKLRYQFESGKEVRITRLIFNQSVIAHSERRNDTLDLQITGLITIDFECVAQDAAAGKSWKLYVFVDDCPIYTGHADHAIAGKTGVNGKSMLYNAYSI